MNVTITLDHATLQRVLSALEELGGAPPADLVALVGDAVARDGVMKRVINYPPMIRKAQPFVSDKQRRWFFANLRSGALSVPYERTYRLQRGWQPFRTSTGAEVRNDVPYAGMVMGSKGDQSSYFAGKSWLSIDRIARDVEAEDAPGLAAGAVSLWIAKRGLS